MDDHYNSIIVLLFIVTQTSVMHEASTEGIIHINATLGDDVTLRLPEEEIKADIEDIMWLRADGNHFVTTAPDREVKIRDRRYNGRLNSSYDASLTIMIVTMGDQGVYTANVALKNDETYVQKYNVSIKARSSDKVTINDHKASTLDACTVSCRRNNRDVTLTCDQTSPQNISAVYDPDTCTCGPWNADCAPCVLEQYCKKDGDSPLIARGRVVVAAVVLVAAVVGVAGVGVGLIKYRRHHKKKTNTESQEKPEDTDCLNANKEDYSYK